MASPAPSISDLPAELILERLLPILPLHDLISLSATSKLFNILCSDQALWSDKTRSDFSFSPSMLAPPASSSGWSKRVYLGMRSPRIFVWGSTDNSRLGTDAVHERVPDIRQHRRSVDVPMELTAAFPISGKGRTWTEALKDSLARGLETLGEREAGTGGIGAGIVELQAGGWSFTARDMDGGLWVWGQLDGSLIRFRAPSWEDKHCQVPEPTRIPLPCRAEAISAGRNHLLVLDQDNLIWELRAWGRAYHHTSAALTSPTNTGSSGHPRHIVQLSTGWSHSACLTASGTIHIWYPFSAGYEAALTPDAELNGPLGLDGEDKSHLLKWGTVSGDAVSQLEAIPMRPVDDRIASTPDRELIGEDQAGWDEWMSTRRAKEEEWRQWKSSRGPRELEEKEKVVKIASGLDCILALKGNGEVWYCRVKDEEGQSSSAWSYLQFISSPTISHISAQYDSITAYSTTTSSVYHAKYSEASYGYNVANLRPDPLHSLQGKGVIQVALGDYHHLALTSSGEVYSWGRSAQGQLGLGGTSKRGIIDVDEPEKVVFPGDKEGKEGCFVFGITAAGWHTGALVLGDPRKKPAVEEEEAAKREVPVEDTEDESAIPGSYPRGRIGNHGTVPPIFRIGFAGRGSVSHITRRNQGAPNGGVNPDPW